MAGMVIVTGNLFFKRSYKQYIKEVINQAMKRRGIVAMGYDRDTEPILANVNHGRWIIDCPDCKSAQLAFEEGWFFCMHCCNGSVGHRFRKTVFPEQRQEAEALLVQRRLQNRNWRPDRESIDYLQNDNNKHKEQMLWRGTHRGRGRPQSLSQLP